MHYLTDDIFQADCQIGYLRDYLDEGGKIESVVDDTVTITLRDGSEAHVYLGPIYQLLVELRELA